jgi:hypothetical protein
MLSVVLYMLEQLESELSHTLEAKPGLSLQLPRRTDRTFELYKLIAAFQLKYAREEHVTATYS